MLKFSRPTLAPNPLEQEVSSKLTDTFRTAQHFRTDQCLALEKRDGTKI
jgi:hypothetical protein